MTFSDIPMIYLLLHSPQDSKCHLVAPSVVAIADSLAMQSMPGIHSYYMVGKVGREHLQTGRKSDPNTCSFSSALLLSSKNPPLEAHFHPQESFTPQMLVPGADYSAPLSRLS